MSRIRSRQALTLALPLAVFSLNGCIAVRVAGDVAEGATKATVATGKAGVKAAGKAADVVTPGGGDDADDDRDGDE